MDGKGSRCSTSDLGKYHTIFYTCHVIVSNALPYNMSNFVLNIVLVYFFSELLILMSQFEFRKFAMLSCGVQKYRASNFTWCQQ